jgi:methionine-rich copper-binding protein CopC
VYTQASANNTSALASNVLIDLLNVAGTSFSEPTANQFTVADNVAPTVTISDSDADTVNIVDGTVTFTFTFSESVNGFDISKVNVGNGTSGTFTVVSSTVYTLIVTPTASSSGNITVDVNTTGVTDAVGNVATAPAQYTQDFDTAAPTLAITTPISTDNFVNNVEDESSLTISGTSAGAEGRTVTVAVGSITGQTATITAGGAWSITLTSAQLKTLTEGTVNITANVSDTAGNPATQATASFVYDITAPTLAITTPISTDNFVNNVEDESSLTISGTSSGADGRTVTVVVGSITGQTATITAGGAWSISLTSAQLKTLSEGTVNITANVSDTAGNPATQATASFTYDITAPTLAITTPISTDNFVNNVEDESSLTISGTSSGADGRTVTVAVGSITGQTATIAAGGAWSITLTSAQLKTLTEGTVNITANVSDTAGNPATQATASFTYDRTAPTLLSSTPADGATDAGVSNNLVLNFSETVAAGSGLISLYRANGSLVESFDGATGVGSAGGSVAFSGSAVTINPFADLVRGSGYYLQVAPTAIRDGAGNLYAGISDAPPASTSTPQRSPFRWVRSPSVSRRSTPWLPLAWMRRSATPSASHQRCSAAQPASAATPAAPCRCSTASAGCPPPPASASPPAVPRYCCAWPSTTTPASRASKPSRSAPVPSPAPQLPSPMPAAPAAW